MAVKKTNYKPTAIGSLPVEWECKRLGEFSNPVRGGSPRPAGDPKYFGGNYIPWLTVASLTNISEYELFVTETQGCLTEEGSRYSRTLEKETLIIANSGATLGVAKLLGIKCCANDGVAALLEIKNSDKAYLCYFINSQTKSLRETVATGNGQPNLNTKIIGNISVPLPTLSEQREIAHALSDVDQLLTSLSQLIAKKRDVKQAAMQQLLTGRRRLPGFNGKWEEKKLGDIGSFGKGKGIKKDEVLPSGLPCIRYGEIYTRHNDYVREIRSFISPLVAAQSCKIKKGDLLFAGSGETSEEIGKCVAFLGDEETYAGGDIVILTPNKCDSQYLGYLMNHPLVVEQKSRLGQGDAVVHISARNLASISVNLPPTLEQAAIAGMISDIDEEISALEQKSEKTKLLKQGMMQELLTGRIRLV